MRIFSSTIVEGISGRQVISYNTRNLYCFAFNSQPPIDDNSSAHYYNILCIYLCSSFKEAEQQTARKQLSPKYDQASDFPLASCSFISIYWHNNSNSNTMAWEIPCTSIHERKLKRSANNQSLVRLAQRSQRKHYAKATWCFALWYWME